MSIDAQVLYGLNADVIRQIQDVFSKYGKIENDLDDLLLPYKMDVSLLHQIQDDSLLDHILRIGKIFYVRG